MAKNRSPLLIKLDPSVRTVAEDLYAKVEKINQKGQFTAQKQTNRATVSTKNLPTAPNVNNFTGVTVSTGSDAVDLMTLNDQFTTLFNELETMRKALNVGMTSIRKLKVG